MLDKLFKFPIATIDGMNEEKKMKKAEDYNMEEQELDMVIGEAECPYYDFLCISDRWLPTKESFQDALDGNFNACYVVFSSSGSFIVPWSKEKFKKELQNFIDNLPKEAPTVSFSLLDPDDVKKLFGEKKEKEKDKEDE